MLFVQSFIGIVIPPGGMGFNRFGKDLGCIFILKK